MEKIIPFRKEIDFKTKISEISSISLEHTITSIKEDSISGEFIIEGEYKIIEGSINRESYNYTIPFDIALDSRYNIKNIEVDIDDFYYDIVDQEKLSISIDLIVKGLELQEEIIPSIIPDKKMKEELVDNIIEEEIISVESNNLERESENEMINDIDVSIVNENDNKNENDNINIFDNIDEVDTYTTYRVYFVKEGDNIEKILTKYNITKEELENYNDISEIKEGTKLIIPTSNE